MVDRWVMAGCLQCAQTAGVRWAAAQRWQMAAMKARENTTLQRETAGARIFDQLPSTPPATGIVNCLPNLLDDERRGGQPTIASGI
jgi:hypothetical protein